MARRTLTYVLLALLVVASAGAPTADQATAALPPLGADVSRQSEDGAAPDGGATIQATFTVTKTTDSNDGSCDPRDCSLREAVNAANASTAADVITVPPGGYALTLGSLNVTGALAINGAGTAATIIDAGQRDRVFFVNAGANVTINALTIQRGSVGADGDGGCIQSLGTLTLTAVVVTDCTAGEDGGGIQMGSGSITLDGVTVANNRGGFSGGGIALEVPGPSHTLTIRNSVIRNNFGSTAVRGHDGGGLAFDGGTVAITDSAITDNVTTRGGGFQMANNADVTLTNVTIARNTGQQEAGGLQMASGILRIRNSTINNNTTNEEEGGGLELGRGEVLLENVTISGNVAARGGGGVSVGANGPTIVQATNVTIVGNSAPGGSNILVDDDGPGTLRLKNAIVANGQGSQNCVILLPGGSIQSQGNNIDTGTSCGLAAAGDQQNTDPRLGPLANNGGPTQTHALAPGSPAIDRGTNTGCPATDQRGVPRPQGSACDIGAFELAGTPPTPPPSCSPRPNVAVRASNAGGGRLRVVVTANTGPGAPNNVIQAIRFEAGANALVSVNNQPPRGGPFTASFGNSNTVEFFITRQAAGATTQPFVVIDACGEWRSFAGGGPNAF